jgi:DNA-binding protein HU-beta
MRYIMNKTELIAAVAEKTGLKKADAKAAVEAVLASVADTLAAGNDVTLPGFGTFTVKAREAREGRNPLTGETITIAASKAPAFKAGAALKAQVNK